MSDTDENQHLDEEVWEDLVELEEVPDGPTTLFVGGFSRYKSINEALESVLTANDRIVLLDKNSQDGDVTIDTTRYCGVSILSACERNTTEAPRVLSDEEAEALEMERAAAEEEEEGLDEEELMRRRLAAKAKKDTTVGNFIVNGRLVLHYSEPTEGSKLPSGFIEDDEDDDGAGPSGGDDDDEDGDGAGDGDGNGGNNGDYDDEDEDGARRSKPRPPALNINGINFSNGVVAEAQTNAYLEDCAFGTAAFQPSGANGSSGANETNTAVHALSTVAFTRCQLYGSNKAAVYCFPHSRATFTDCDVKGAKRPLTAEEIAALNAKKPRGYVAPPPPAPSVPSAADLCCATGIFADDASAVFTNVDVSNVGIGVYAVGPSKGLRIESSAVKQCGTVGLLFDGGCEALAKGVAVTLCGRECAVFGAGHPTVRECTFVGDVRLKARCEATGITDNVLGNSAVVINEDATFHIKGFTQVPHDPTAPKKPKKSTSDF